MKIITIQRISFSDEENCAFCLQIDPESFVLDFSLRSVKAPVLNIFRLFTIETIMSNHEQSETHRHGYRFC